MLGRRKHCQWIHQFCARATSMPNLRHCAVWKRNTPLAAPNYWTGHLIVTLKGMTFSEVGSSTVFSHLFPGFQHVSKHASVPVFSSFPLRFAVFKTGDAPWHHLHQLQRQFRNRKQQRNHHDIRSQSSSLSSAQFCFHVLLLYVYDLHVCVMYLYLTHTNTRIWMSHNHRIIDNLSFLYFFFLSKNVPALIPTLRAPAVGSALVRTRQKNMLGSAIPRYQVHWLLVVLMG